MPHAVSTAVSKTEVSDFHQVAPILIYTVSQKRLPFIFWITLKKLPILMISGTWNPEKIWHENLTDCPLRLSDVATVPWEIQKSHFQQYYSYVLLISYVISQENNL